MKRARKKEKDLAEGALQFEFQVGQLDVVGAGALLGVGGGRLGVAQLPRQRLHSGRTIALRLFQLPRPLFQLAGAGVQQPLSLLQRDRQLRNNSTQSTKRKITSLSTKKKGPSTAEMFSDS